MTPSEWLLARYDHGLARPACHVRKLLEVVDDYPAGSTPEFPRWSGAARWPDPYGTYDLDRLDRAEFQTQLVARRTA